MNPNILKFTAFLLILAGVLSACKKPDDTIVDYPINIPFTEYALDETSCQWKNLPYDEKVILINSNEALENYISCTEGSYPVIDFSKNSLLLVSGKTGQKITDIFAKDLKQLALYEYELGIKITMTEFLGIEPWCLAFLVEKMSKENDVKLNIESLYLPQEPYSILGTWVLVEKEIDGVKEILPENEIPYLVTLTYFSDTDFHGRCDANTYEGIYHRQLDNISLRLNSITDCSGTDWYWSYLSELSATNKVVLTDTTMQLSYNRTLIFNFVSREKFERDYSELPEWYNF
jgi:hypothetical protein